MSKPKLPLAIVQQWMQRQLLDPSGTTASTEDSLWAIEDIIKPSSRLAAWQHLAIYQHGYTARLRNCMAKQFPALEYALSEKLFQAFADEYLKVYPSKNYNLAKLGDRFAAYLSETRPDNLAEEKEEWPDFMIELAQFESAINHLFDEALDDDYQLASTATPIEQLRLVPGLRLFAFTFPIRPFYSAFNQDEEPDLPLPEASYCAVLRRGYKLKTVDLQATQYTLLKHILGGESWSAACQLTEDHLRLPPHEWEESWAVWLSTWLVAGFFCQ